MAVIVWQAAYPVLAACILYEISRLERSLRKAHKVKVPLTRVENSVSYPGLECDNKEILIHSKPACAVFLFNNHLCRAGTAHYAGNFSVVVDMISSSFPRFQADNVEMFQRKAVQRE